MCGFRTCRKLHVVCFFASNSKFDISLNKIFCLEDFLLIQITFRILNAKLHNFLVVKSSKERPKHGKLYYMGFVHAGNLSRFFASNNKFGISLNIVFVSKNFLVIFVLLFVDSFQVASNF